MALVAYSDDSDIGSEAEDVEETERSNINANKAEKNSGNKANIVSSSTKISSASSGSGNIVHSSIDDIIDIDDEDESFVKRKSSLLASIPAALPVNFMENSADIGEDEDVLTDVPTVDTWKITADIKKGTNNANPLTSSHSESSSKTTKAKEKKKVKIFIPALSEFDDDEEEEDKKEEPERKKIKVSSKGTGLFSVLPEPKHVSVKEAKRPLIPYVLTKAPPAPKVTKPRPRPTVQTKSAFENNDSDDDKDGDTVDFFSLAKSQPDIGSVEAIPIPAEKVEMPIANVHDERFKVPENKYVPGDSRTNMFREPATSADVCHPHQAGSSDSFQDQETHSENSFNMDQEAMIRLMGKKRRKNEEINFINVNADDALLTRDEWMTKSLSEEKPSHSFSKKKEGLPSQKQKQKHQITYLAHQAKERELELKNNWAQNRMTKMQTQAKYGF